MTLDSVMAKMRRACARQLYDEWGGYYLLQRLVYDESGIFKDDRGTLRIQTMPRYVDVRPLTRAQAMKYRCKTGEALQLIFNQGVNHMNSDYRAKKNLQTPITGVLPKPKTTEPVITRVIDEELIIHSSPKRDGRGALYVEARVIAIVEIDGVQYEHETVKRLPLRKRAKAKRRKRDAATQEPEDRRLH